MHMTKDMPIKKLTLSTVLLAGILGVGQAGQHVVSKGDNLFDIAQKYGVPARDILRANNLDREVKLQVGQKILIPRAPAKVAKATTNNASRYIVRNGDHDWSISAKLGLTPHQLRVLNPGVNWRRLQIGQSLNVGKGQPPTVAKATSKPKVKPVGKYVVQKLDNDWVIARKLGTTPKKLRLVNLGTEWTKLRPGQVLNVPGNLPIQGTIAMVSNSPIKSRYARVSENVVSVRREPSTSSGRVTSVSAGARGTVVDREGMWVKLKFPHGTTGWVRGDLLSPVSSLGIGKKPVLVAKSSTTQKSTTRTTVAKARPVRNPRIARNSVARRAPVVSKSAPKYVANAAVAGAVVDKAQGWQGVRYRYGAMSRSATDCSGFTSQVYKSVGVTLPRTSREQSKVGAKVPSGTLKEGDLVFFRTTRGNRISHVGIYVGNNRFIHASSGKGQVRVDSLSSSYYKNRFVTARRVATKQAQKPVAKPVAQKQEAPKSVETTETPKPAETTNPTDGGEN
jgi:cell wall-associated NlpC family hydrolase